MKPQRLENGGTHNIKGRIQINNRIYNMLCKGRIHKYSELKNVNPNLRIRSQSTMFKRSNCPDKYCTFPDPIQNMS